jgi:hypothetical protein
MSLNKMRVLALASIALASPPLLYEFNSPGVNLPISRRFSGGFYMPTRAQRVKNKINRRVYGLKTKSRK